MADSNDNPSDAGTASSDLSPSDAYPKLKEDLSNILDSIKAPGEFHSFKPIDNPPPGGIIVHGVGEISMPLGEEQARKIIAIAHQAPIRRGSEAIVDTSLRSTWEIDATQFRLQDPAWPIFLNKVCDQVAQDMGIIAPIKPKLCNMLIYEKGGMFKAHTDPERFATLVIFLPSTHEGGKVKVEHGNMNVSLKSWESSKATQFFACWYSDALCEVRPVKAGYRWVLTYNLALDLDKRLPKAHVLPKDTAALRQCIQRLVNSKHDKSPAVYYVLDHDYAPVNLSRKMLKRRDLAVVQALADVSKELPVEIFLTILEKETTSELNGQPTTKPYVLDLSRDMEATKLEYHVITETGDLGYRVSKVVVLQGRHLRGNLRLNPEDILWSNNRLGPGWGNVREEEMVGKYDDDEDYRTADPVISHLYFVTAVAIVPRHSTFGFLNQQRLESAGEKCQPSWIMISQLAQSCLALPSDKCGLLELRKFCDQAWDAEPSPSDLPTIIPHSSFDPNGMRDALMVMIQQEWFDVFERGASRHRTLLPLDLFTLVRKWLGSAPLGQRFPLVKKGLSIAIDTFRELSTKLRAIETIAPVITRGSDDLMLAWARESIRSSIQGCTKKFPLGEADGRAMIDISMYFEVPVDFLSETVLTTLERTGQLRNNNSAFSLGFFSQLHGRITNKANPILEATTLYAEIAEHYITQTDFSQEKSLPEIQLEATKQTNDMHLPTAEHETRNFYHTQHLHLASSKLLDPSSLLILITTLSDGPTKDPDLLTTLTTTLTNLADLIELPTHKHLWLPFLGYLLDHFTTTPTTPSPIITPDAFYTFPRIIRLYRSFLTAYRNKTLGEAPPPRLKPVNGRRPTLQCTCDDCVSLNKTFLGNKRRLKTTVTVATGDDAEEGRRIFRRHWEEKAEEVGADVVFYDGDGGTIEVVKVAHGKREGRMEWARRREVMRGEVEGALGRVRLERLLGRRGLERLLGEGEGDRGVWVD